MSVGCRVASLFLVLLALFQAVPVAVDAWHTGRLPGNIVSWVRLALLPVALWLYLRYFSILGCRQCGEDDGLR